MAIGFGRSMISSDMVLLWRDSNDGHTIVSQRKTSVFSMPTVVSNPPRVATALDYRATSNSSAVTLSFSVPSITDTRQDLIWAWSSDQPSGNTPDATIVQHDDEGNFVLSLTNLQFTDDSSTPTTTTTPTGGSSGSSSSSSPLTHYQKVFAAHGILMTLAFLVFLPFGALQARLLRTSVEGKWWFGAHWIIQWPLTAILIIVGFALAVDEVGDLRTGHLNSTHKKWGLVIVLLYVVQCMLGGVIHHFKPARATGRPPQNYFHAILGITIIALSFWQVHTGFDIEWESIGGEPVSKSIRAWWTAWIVIIPLMYVAGLALLPRQYRREREQRTANAAKLQPTYALRETSYRD
ncbi:hypothetical protein FRC16_010874 [Serendipita sp. 398]|nr:hypothetical protein FRC16_010874 [Serendipita sp. 398]